MGFDEVSAVGTLSNSVTIQRLVVINPSACDFEAQRRWPELEDILKQAGPFQTLQTDPDDGITTAKIRDVLQADPAIDRVVAIGGDGTAHLAVNAIMRSELRVLPELAVIPFGTANDVAKSLKLPVSDLPKLAEIANGPAESKLDVARLKVLRDGQEPELHYFIDSVTLGMDADVLAARSKFRKDLKGYLSYVPALAERVVEQKSLDVRIECDGQVIDGRAFNVVINNVPVYAGVLWLPGASASDQLLDVYLFNRRQYVSKLLSFAIKATDVLDLGVSEALEEITDNQQIHRGRSVKIRLAHPRKLQIDGEIFGESAELEAEIAAQLRVAGVAS